MSLGLQYTIDFKVCVVVTGDKLSAVLLSSVINYRQCRNHGIEENPGQDVFASVNNTRDN